MSSTDKVFAGSIPKIYDEYLVPLIFSHYAADIASVSRALRPSTAAGNRRRHWRGHARRDRRRCLPASVTSRPILNEPMLAVAAQRQERGRAHVLASRRMPPRCPSTMPRSTWSAASSAPCSFRIASWVMPRRSGSCGRQGTFRVQRLGPHRGERVRRRGDGRARKRSFPTIRRRFMARTPHGYHDKAVINADLEQRAFVTSRLKRFPR
jgi:hypothetical protein